MLIYLIWTFLFRASFFHWRISIVPEHESFFLVWRASLALSLTFRAAIATKVISRRPENQFSEIVNI